MDSWTHEQKIDALERRLAQRTREMLEARVAEHEARADYGAKHGEIVLCYRPDPGANFLALGPLRLREVDREHLLAAGERAAVSSRCKDGESFWVVEKLKE